MDFSVIQYDVKTYNALYNRKHKQNKTKRPISIPMILSLTNQEISVNNICQSFRFKSLGFLFSLSSLSGSTNLEPFTEMATDMHASNKETLLRIFEH